MPELPEVENVKRKLAKHWSGHRIEAVEFTRANIRFGLDKKWIKKLTGQTVVGVDRRAKYLIINLDSGFALSHLGMTGDWRELDQELLKHDHIIITFSNGKKFAFNDPRRFGFFLWIEKDKLKTNKFLKILGFEPLGDEDFNEEWLYKKLKSSRAPIKSFIMNQKLVVGVGNIYASEALFLAKIKPTRIANRVKRDEVGPLIIAIRQVLQRAIDAGGSTIRDYGKASGTQGSYQNSHLVYDQKSLPCPNCQTPIRHQMIAGRSTYWCPKCQK